MSGNSKPCNIFSIAVLLAQLILVISYGSIAYATTTTHSCSYGMISGSELSSSGSCSVNTSETINTTYTGPQDTLGPGTPYGNVHQNLPVTAAVLSYNQQSNKNQYLITCPFAPNPTETVEYFNATPNAYIGGDQCLANTDKLQSNIGVLTTTSWTDTNPAASQVKVVASNLARPTVNDIAYSGETCGSVSSCLRPILASGYDSKSYIYNGEPSQSQYGIWSWYSNYANLDQVNNNQAEQLNQLYLYPNTTQYPYVQHLVINNSKIVPTQGQVAKFYVGTDCNYYPGAKNPCQNNYYTQRASESWQVWCNYTYNYASTAQLLSIKNANISVPSSLPQTGTTQLVVESQSYGPWTQTSAPNGGLFYTDACLGALYDDFLVSTACGSGYTYISGDGEITNPPQGGPTETGVVVYAGPSPGEYTTVWCAGGYFCDVGNNVQEGVVAKASLFYENVSILPYFLYNISMPAISTTASPGGLSYLNLSFDLYSPHNYLNPNTNLDPFPIDTGSILFANVSTGSRGQLTAFPLNVIAFSNPNPNGLSSPEVSLITASTSINNTLKRAGLRIGGLISAGPIGKYGGGSIYNPSFITSAPNDYVYILNSTAGCVYCWSSSSNVILYTARFIPEGYYNTSNTEPNTLPPNTTSSQWQQEWRNYWANITAEQSQTMYITNYSVISTVNGNPLSGVLCWAGVACNTATNNLAPSAIATDYGGDIFVMGQVYYSSSNPANVIGIAEIHPPSVQDNNKEVVAVNTSVPLATGVTNFLHTSEFAVSPGGQAIYIASPYAGNVLVYAVGGVNASANPAKQAFVYASNMSLSYSNSSVNLNISKYMENGGPFENSQIASAYANFCSSGCSANDIEGNHFPLGIAVYQGIIYVLDDWYFGVSNNNGGLSGPSTLYSNILMLRAFLPSGKEIPMAAFPYADTQPSATNYAATTSASQSNLNVGFPPYGWPLSANISISSGSSIAYCAVGCSNNPTSQTYNGFLPVGPLMPLCNPQEVSDLFGGASCVNGESNLGNIGFSSDFNGTDYIIANVIMKYNGFGSNTRGPAELLALKPLIQNYTKLSFGADSPYTCYTDSIITPSACTPNPEISNMHPPVAGVPSSFEYIESQGTPSVFLAPATSVPSSGAIPGSSGATQSGVNNLTNNGTFPGGTKASNLPGFGNNTFNYQGTGVSPYFGPINLTSKISGYVLVPYNVTYQLTQTYTNEQLKNSAGQPWPPGSTCESQNPPWQYQYYDYYYSSYPYPPYFSYSQSGPYYTTIDVCSQSRPPQPYSHKYCSFPASDSQTTTTEFTYGQVDTKRYSPKPSIIGQIEGGPTYLEQSGLGLPYEVNLSDAALIIPPYINYAIFTSRVFGEIYVNQTFGTTQSGKSPIINPYTLEGFQNQTYQQYDVMQGSYPGYAIEESFPQSGSASSLGKIGLRNPAGGYYYSINKPPGGLSSGFNYSVIGNATGPKPPVELFAVYHESTHLNGMLLNLTHNSYLPGYNRLIYTYVDRFNNTVYMPFDVDFANITTIQLSVTAHPNVSAPNQTTLYINGTAGFDTPWEQSSSGSIFHPLPAGKPIYLYYDYNLNFYNPAYGGDLPPIGQPPRGTLSQGLKAYLEYDLKCAFPYNALNYTGCIQADPANSTAAPVGEGLYGALEGNMTTFATQFNQSHMCPAPPVSLLQTSPPDCNIYDPKNAIKTLGNGEVAYCIPTMANGTGTLSSQVGLMNITLTNSTGQFSFSTTVCGIGPHQITARYYGYPYPEPQTFMETPIANSSGASEFYAQSGPFSGLYQPTQEYNYSYAPNQSVANFQIGIFQLDYGNVSIAVAILVLLSAASIVFYMNRQRRPTRRRARLQQ